MNEGTTKVRSIRCLLLSVCAVYLGVPALAQVMTSPDPPKTEIVQKLNNQVSMDLTFTDENGKTVALRDLTQGKPVVLALVYYECPMLCGEVMQGMLKVFNELDFTIGDEYTVITVSFNPEEKSDLATLKKKNLMEHYKSPEAAAGWHFLTTSNEDNVHKLAESVGFQYAYLPSVDQYVHASGIMLLTPDGKVSRYYYGIEYPERDLRFGLIDASDGKIGALADQVLLLCFQYDPASGTYGFVIMSALRIGGIVTMACLGLFVGTMLLRERRRRIRDERTGPAAA